MNPLRVACGAGLALVLGAGAAAAASAPRWVREQAALATPPHPDDCPALVLLDRTSARVARDLTIEVHRQRAVRLLTSEGGEAATFGFTLEPGAELHDLDAWTVSVDEVRGHAGRGERVERNVSDIGYSDLRAVTLTAPAARPGDLVAVEATWTEPEPFPLYSWWPQDENLPTRLAELDLELPSDWQATAHGYHVDAALPAAPSNHVHLALADVAMVPDEPSRPALSALLPHVVVRFVGASGQPDLRRWEDVATWYARLSAAATAASQCPADLASAARGDKLERLEALAAEVQRDVRYVAIELGKQRWEPDPGATTWQRRYGDCKDKAALLVAALQSIGVEARPMLVCTRSRSEVDPDSPDPLQFNHCIVAIAWPGDGAPPAATVQGPSGRRWTVFDPTDTWVPLGFVSAELGGTWGVIADPREGLVRLPAPSPSTLAVTVAGRMDDRGGLLARITLAAEGPASAALRAGFGAVDPSERLARAREYLAARWPQAALDSCRVEAADSSAMRCAIEMDARLPDLARPAGGAWLLSPGLLSAWQRPPSRDSLRRLPLVLGPPGRYEERWGVQLPGGLAPEPTPPVEWRGPVADYSAAVSGQSGQFILRRTLELRSRQVAPDQYPAVRGLLRAVYSGDHPSILLTRP
jgi:transglutaminase-like putative cysteine protease